jgi:DNA-binding CsgD family transcriptional regulator
MLNEPPNVPRSSGSRPRSQTAACKAPSGWLAAPAVRPVSLTPAIASLFGPPNDGSDATTPPGCRGSGSMKPRIVASPRRLTSVNDPPAGRERTACWLSRCEGARTPALRLAPAGPVLTDRERQVAGLAARGHTGRQIADELTLSVRTVDSHLAHVYTKLGVASRAEPRAALS